MARRHNMPKQKSKLIQGVRKYFCTKCRKYKLDSCYYHNADDTRRGFVCKACHCDYGKRMHPFRAAKSKAIGSGRDAAIAAHKARVKAEKALIERKET